MDLTISTLAIYSIYIIFYKSNSGYEVINFLILYLELVFVHLNIFDYVSFNYIINIPGFKLLFN
jgi:hypothetical protein